MKNLKIICVVGPTASGKSEIAVKLAKKYGGEIISADSRQIYRGMNIGTGKVEGAWKNSGLGKTYIYKGIPHHLIDEASPKRQFTVARFQKKASILIKQITERGHIPIICGGTMNWIDSVVFGLSIPAVKPDPSLRKELSKLTTEQLYKKLEKMDPSRAKNIDPKNPRRLIRALEIVYATGKPVPNIEHNARYETLWLGINPGMETLEGKIKKRLLSRLNQGMLKEVANLHQSGLSWKKLESFGLEYKYCAMFLQSILSKDDMETKLFTEIRRYAKRQITWWKRNKEIHWSERPASLLDLAKKFLK